MERDRVESCEMDAEQTARSQQPVSSTPLPVKVSAAPPQSHLCLLLNETRWCPFAHARATEIRRCGKAPVALQILPWRHLTCMRVRFLLVFWFRTSFAAGVCLRALLRALRHLRGHYEWLTRICSIVLVQTLRFLGSLQPKSMALV